MKIRWNEVFLGRAKDPLNPRVFHTLSLAAFFAWVGLGADGLSSSCYGPEEAFKALLENRHPYLALPLAGFVALTVFVLSASYAILIELFPSGGGGYLVSTKLLGKGPGVVCGCALILDYMLTIAISVAACMKAFFSTMGGLPAGWEHLQLYGSLAVLGFLILLNLRGVKESIVVLLPIFLVFLFTHLVGIGAALLLHAPALPSLLGSIPQKMAAGARVEGGWLGILAVFFGAYSLGAGTYTGIEAVSNSMQILREPRAATGKRTMLYMAVSLALTAAGLLVGYLLFNVTPERGRTLNAVLFDRVFGGFDPGGIPVGQALLVVTLLAEGALLLVAAQAGFIGGPRTLAIMAVDRWVPTRFSYLSNRLVIQDGVFFMGGGGLLFLFFTRADPDKLVILYSINVFVTFTLAQLGLCRHWIQERPAPPAWRRKLSINAVGVLLSAGILVIMVWSKFTAGGWVTILITSVAILICYLVHAHYEVVRRSIRDLDLLIDIPPEPLRGPPPQKDPNGPTAVLLVGGFNGLGIHSFLNVLRLFPDHFKNFIFVSVGVVDYERFQDQTEMENLRLRTVEGLEKYVERARSMGIYAEHRHAFGTELVDEIERLAQEVVKEYPGAIFFGGQLVFEHENFLTRSLHSQAAFEIQRRLQFSGLAMVLMPVRVRPQPEAVPPIASHAAGPGLGA
jgi:hypothetical protein